MLSAKQNDNYTLTYMIKRYTVQYFVNSAAQVIKNFLFYYINTMSILHNINHSTIQ